MGSQKLFVMGDDHPAGWTTTLVYEAAANDSFVRVARLPIFDNAIGGNRNALGNLDGVGNDEYIVRASTIGLVVFRAMAPGQWTTVLEDPDPLSVRKQVHTFDVNQNGRDEVFWDTDNIYYNTLVLEHPEVTPSTVGEDPGFRIAPLSISPNPCRSLARLYVPGSERDAAKLAVYDVAGRLLERRTPIRDAGGQLLWPARGFPPGVYLLRLESANGATVATGRTVVVR